MQTNYNIYSNQSKKGQLADSGFHDIVSKLVSEVIEVARVVVRVIGDVSIPGLVRLPKQNKVIQTNTGAFTAGSIAVTIAGVKSTTPFGTDLATTMTAFAAQIAALASIASAAYDTGAKTLTIVSKNSDAPVAASFDLTGITGNFAATYSSSSTDAIYGAAVVSDSLVPDLTTGLVAYTPTGPQTANILRRGRMYVLAETAMTTDSPVYVRTLVDGSDATLVPGNVRADSASGSAVLWSKAIVSQGCAAGGNAVIEINP